MHDVLHRGARDDGERAPPEIERQVFDADDALVQAVHEMLHDIGQHHGHEEHEAHLVEDDEERRPESHVDGGVDEWEAHRYEEGGEEIGEERIGGHLLQVSAQFGRHHGSGRRARTNDTGEQRLEQDEVVALDVEDEHGAHHHHDEGHLEHTHPEMPPHGPELVEVDLAKGDEEDEEHEHGEDGIDDGLTELSRLVELGREGEHQVDERSGEHRHRQCPFLEKSQQSCLLFAYAHTLMLTSPV